MVLYWIQQLFNENITFEYIAVILITTDTVRIHSPQFLISSNFAIYMNYL